jgi:formylglycine-generating enzyme
MKNLSQAVRTFCCVIGLVAGAALHADTVINHTEQSVQVPLLTFLSQTGYTYLVQYATNSGTAWTTAETLAGTGNPLESVGIEGATRSNLTWRVVEVPPAPRPPPVATPTGMVLITNGTFLMGQAGAKVGNGPQHTVNVSTFCMDSNLVSYAVWTDVYHWAIDNGYQFGHAGLGKAANHPVHTIDWYDAVKWCNARSEMEGLAPCYYTDASKSTIYRTGTNNLLNNCVNWSANGYRLPTEAEYEKAARGGLTGKRFPWGDTISENRANYFGNTYAFGWDSGPNGFNPYGNSGGRPYSTAVTQFAPNAFGLRDMAGNVEEWCWDWFSRTYYSSSPAADPQGPGNTGYRVLRGGCWADLASALACDVRNNKRPASAINTGGFRCVRIPSN